MCLMELCISDVYLAMSRFNFSALESVGNQEVRKHVLSLLFLIFYMGVLHWEVILYIVNCFKLKSKEEKNML